MRNSHPAPQDLIQRAIHRHPPPHRYDGAGTDQEVEITRVYYRDGRLKGERVRVRECVLPAQQRSGAQDAGCLALMWLAGTAWGLGYLGGVIIGGGLGVAIGLCVWVYMIWCRM